MVPFAFFLFAFLLPNIQRPTSTGNGRGRGRGRPSYAKAAILLVLVLLLGGDNGSFGIIDDDSWFGIGITKAAAAADAADASLTEREGPISSNGNGSGSGTIPSVPVIPPRRDDRFPSVVTRVKLYMSNWYSPPCEGDEKAFIGYTLNHTDTEILPSGDKTKARRWPTLRVMGYEDHPVFADSGGDGGGDDEIDDDIEDRNDVDDETEDDIETGDVSDTITITTTTTTTSENTTRILNRVTSIIEPDKLFFMDQQVMISCGNWTEDTTSAQDPYLKRVKWRKNMRMYCEDVVDLMIPAWNHLRLQEAATATAVATAAKTTTTTTTVRRRISEDGRLPTKEPPPTLLQFGDNKQSHVYKNVNVPHIKKFRSAAQTPRDLADVTPDGCYSSSSMASNSNSNNGIRRPLLSAHGDDRFQPIVWKLATDRHFKKLNDVYRYDQPWHYKKDMAVFKGALTGSRDGYNKKLSAKENCYNMRRCRLVLEHSNSTLIEAKLTRLKDRLPKVLEGVPLTTTKTKIDDLLGYKGIIMIEGNDVASGLKWALLSQSVVLMAPPKHTSWCMEELLEPWVHYIPLDEFATNAEERMQWIIDHDEEARRISERATLWMEDLVFHPDAMEDDRLIQEEILKRYEAHFLSVAGE